MASQSNPIRTIWRRLWLIALVVVVLVGAAAAFSYWQTPTYRASIKVLIGQEEPQASNYIPNLQTEVMGLENLTGTMAQAIDTRPVAQDVVDRLDLPMAPQGLLSNLEAKEIAETQFINVTYEDSSAERTELVANTIGDVFSEQVAEMRPSSSSSITATVWERAATPGMPVSPNWTRNVLLALALGSMLGVGLALLLENVKKGDSGGPDRHRLEGQGSAAADPEREDSLQRELPLDRP